MTSTWNGFIDEAWLAQVQEPVLDPELAIVDPHHHIWTEPFPYDAPQLLEDLESGHRVVATVYAEAGRGYRTDGPEHLKPAGETAFMTAVAERAEQSGRVPRICAGITGAADLTMDPARLDELLDAHVAAGKGHFSGIRANIFVTFSPDLAMMPLPGWEGAAERTDFLAGVHRLAQKGLTLDLVCAHVHLPHIARLAGLAPETVIIVNHLAPIADFGRRPAPESGLWAAWRRGIDALVPHANVHMKLGGCANPMMAHSLPAFRSLRDQPRPPTSEQLAELYRPMVGYAIETLGPSRCMFESNFPVDKRSTSYRVLWNAFKRLAHPCSDDERRALLSGTAARVYNLKGLPLQPTFS